MSEFNQLSFVGGMNLLLDDTRLATNQYRLGINLRNRYDVLDSVASSTQDQSAPSGVKQELVTFGEYVLLFANGLGWYKLYNTVGPWTQIPDFQMTATAPRFWTCSVPVATTLYGRLAAAASSTSVNTTSSVNALIQQTQTAAAATGNIPGLLVQDNVLQPWFIYVDNITNQPTARQTQTYDEWSATYGSGTQYGLLLDDQREYVPIGNTMSWSNGILVIAAPDGVNILRSVSGRPLDFVINVNPDGSKGGDAYTTAYSVGVGGISCIRAMSTGGWFVAASNSNYQITLNQTPGAPTIFGEYTFNRAFLFEATCLDDRCIIDSLGDTRFISFSGVRSFNAIEQLQNEGKNSVLSSTINGLVKGIYQLSGSAAAILFDNYEIYALNTVMGYGLVIYDAINSCWSSVDISQTGGVAVKMLAKIELNGIQALYAVTTDDKVWWLYSASTTDEAQCLTLGISANILYANTNFKMNNPKTLVQPRDFRMILNRLTEDATATIDPIIDNRLTSLGTQRTKAITYTPPKTPYAGTIPDLNTQLANLYWALPNVELGWKVSFLLSWSAGSVTQFSVSLMDSTPMNPPGSQGTTK